MLLPVELCLTCAPPPGDATRGGGDGDVQMLQVRDGAAAGMKKLAGEVKGLHQRFDEMEESHRRMTKMLVTVVCMSTGLDVLTVLKGDWL